MTVPGNPLTTVSSNPRSALPARAAGAPPALVAVAHGSRDPRALDTVRALLGLVRALRPELTVRFGHIELNEPPLSAALAALPPGRAVLVPLLLGRGHHVSYDIPAAAADAPHLESCFAAPLGPHPLLAEVLHERLLEAGWRVPGPADGPPGPGAREVSAARATTGHGAVPRIRGGRPRRRPHPSATHAVVLAAAGSRDPDAAVDTRATAALLAARLGVPVVPAYASAAAPSVPEALRMLAIGGWRHTVVASYFTAPGRFATQSADAAAGCASAPLGAHPAMARLLLHRYDQALATAARRRPQPHRLTSA
ncbi:hypothetical protein GCM10018793_61330 [Streptomyces sulfonofaciens]|uniref:Sirohydrochlorin chelatase n=1 Tax=Streptomyces sulfonofaciens TaxID=68272 RepID=A0A919L6U3_9ACTN|nr:CbiX/SirB N-terminal domain-containing protein [Streptomyces sulfonofaciens]GHH87055.1 hypothetical protein GCM10018793_61330 [Streptomyces sulfonofaciens]